MERRRGSCGDLLAMEFVMDENAGVVKQFSPIKPRSSAASTPPRNARRLFQGVPGGGASPVAVADAPPFALSQPSSATSSLAATLADLQVSSRQSSGSNLGDRSQVLAFAAAQAAGRGGSGGTHSRSPSGGELVALAPSSEDGLCSPVLIGAVRSFDTMVLKTLTPIKTRSKAAAQADAALAAPSPPAYAETLVSPFSSGGSLKPKGPMSGRPIMFHARSSSGVAAPGAYNPYDPTAAALSTEFRSPAKSLYSPYTASSLAGSSSHTPSQWGSGSHRGASYRALEAQQALAQSKDDEPDFYISVPGVRRQQSNLASSAARQAATEAAAAVAAAAVVAEAAIAAVPPAGGSPPLACSPLPQHSSSTATAGPQCGKGGDVSLASSPASWQLPTAGSGGRALLRSVSSSGVTTATLGSGTVVHGFKGLFREVITRRK